MPTDAEPGGAARNHPVSANAAQYRDIPAGFRQDQISRSASHPAWRGHVLHSQRSPLRDGHTSVPGECVVWVLLLSASANAATVRGPVTDATGGFLPGTCGVLHGVATGQ